MTPSGPFVLDEKPRVLVVDDEKYIRELLADFLAMEGYFVRTASDGRVAMSELQLSAYDLIVSDLKMPNLGGLELLEYVCRAHPHTPMVIMTGFGTVETAIEAMKRGAYDYVLKPFKADEIVQVVSRALQQRRLEAENLRLREAVSLYKVSEAISASLSLDEVVTTMSTATLLDVHADVSLIYLNDPEKGYQLRQRRQTSSWKQPLTLESCSEAVLERFQDFPFLLEHGSRAQDLFRPCEAVVVSTVIVPLRAREQLIGWLGAVSLTDGKRFDEGQRKLLSMIASRAAAAIDNARLYENLQANFRQTIQSLARTIDKMDHYTAGHSERVARYAMRLAEKLGMSPAEVEIVRQAALMHDIGKIGCVLNLNKPSQLTQQEYEAFKRHPVLGRDILEPVQFLQPVIPGVHLHHERWDGRGYPLGLDKQEIPLLARIISVADTYDAMTSDRAYRRALPHEVAVDEMCRCAGSQFDPDVVREFEDSIEEWLEQWRDEGLQVPD